MAKKKRSTEETGRIRAHARGHACAHMALESAARLAPVRERLAGCRGLFDRAAREIEDKIAQVCTTIEIEKYACDQALDEGLRLRLIKSGISLEGSSKLGRTIEDLQAVRASLKAICGELTSLSGSEEQR